MKKIIIFLSVVLIFAVFAGCNASDQGDVSSVAPNESVADTGENASSSESAPDIDVSGEESGDYIPDDDASVETSGDYDPGVDTSADQSEPETSTPEPEASTPETSAPEVSQPEESTSETSEPQVSEPEVSEPEVSEPEVSEPDEDKVLVRIPTPVVPAVTTPVWDGSIADGFASGTGTEDDPFIIETAAQLAYFALSVDEGNDYLGQFVKLANNIKLNDGNLNVKELDGTGLNKWNAIGVYESAYKSNFMGTFDGDNHVISGMYGDGLFCSINGTVRNIGVVNSHIIGDGGIAGSASVADASQYPGISSDMYLIENCYVVDSVVFSDGGVIGGLLGYVMKNCYNGATVYGTAEWNGGVVGILMESQLINCYNAGTIDGYNPDGGDGILGGLVGRLQRSTVVGCYHVGKLVNYGYSGGALCGASYGKTPFEDCGYLEGTALYAYTDVATIGEQVISSDEIIVLTEEQIDY